MGKRFLLSTVLMVFLLPIPRAASAQDEVQVRLLGGAIANASLDGYEGGYSFTRAGAALSWRWLTLSYTASRFSWDNAEALPFGNQRDVPWEYLHTLDLNAAFSGQTGVAGLNWFAGGNVYSSWEKEMSNSFGFGGRAGIVWDVAKNWRLRLGAFLMYHPTGLDGFPVMGLSWQEDGAEEKGWSFSLGAPSTNLQYRFSPLLAVSLGAGYHYGIHRLADDSPVVSAGYIRHRNIVGGIYSHLSPEFLPGLKITLGLEGNFWRELELYDDDGDKFASYDVGNGLGFILSAAYGF
jgi:hypothetical protein